MDKGSDPAKRPVALVVSLLAGREPERARAVRRLRDRFGPLALLSAPLPFDYTDYYQAEMGPGLSRRLALFCRLHPPQDLARIKRICMSLERDLAHQGRRRVNLDPGFLSAGSLVLATSKYREHRICIGEGLFAELTLWYHHGRFHALPWTYPDYAGQELGRVLEGFRKRYLWQLQHNQPGGGLF